jgi:transposase
MKFSLSEIDRAYLESCYASAREKRDANRINMLLLLDDDYSFAEVASILRMDEDTVRRAVKKYQEKGLEGFLENPFKGGVSKLSPVQLEELSNHIEENFYEKTSEIVDYVKNKFGIKYTNSGMAFLLKRLGFVYKKPTVIPGKADPEQQAEFVEYFKRIYAGKGENDKIYFADGVHAQHNTQAGYGWIKKGKKKNIESNSGRQRVNINGALDPDTLEVITKADDTLNTQATIDFFKLIEEQNPQANKIVVIVDNARYYYNGDVLDYIQKSSKLELVFLPPYAPNLNLIERLWKFMKKKVIYNRYYETFKDFKEAIGTFFQKLPEHHDELESLLTLDFPIVGN